jgi:GNAT superfamily N-acetyltransferase
MLRIRRATEDDRIALFKLSVHMHRETDYRHVSVNPEKLLTNLSLWLNDGLLLVVEKEQQVVGMLFASVRKPWFSDDDYASEDILYVVPEFRGTRAGYMLVRGLVEWVREKGIRHLRAGVSTGTGQAAEKLYRHFGMNFMGSNFIAHFD